jgi:hypothetical protein
MVGFRLKKFLTPTPAKDILAGRDARWYNKRILNGVAALLMDLIRRALN